MSLVRKKAKDLYYKGLSHWEICVELIKENPESNAVEITLDLPIKDKYERYKRLKVVLMLALSVIILTKLILGILLLFWMEYIYWIINIVHAWVLMYCFLLIKSDWKRWYLYIVFIAIFSLRAAFDILIYPKNYQWVEQILWYADIIILTILLVSWFFIAIKLYKKKLD